MAQTPDDLKNTGRDVNTEDFNLMRKLISEIEFNTLQADPIRLMEFYKPIRMMLMEAVADSLNPNDSFLYPNK